ncbi:hypothetical protein SmJEL517_g03416 [Synchytrium microbalum]|uniref:Uncharacterized protein n=1 Tax=Synchytrium microbalum TaxID=1806994 RepID=A0A507C335_9FUNG|nr:uncharacterized protein SmJEL517_g03416 [Synchytrium microbalum]TPX33778.1 hypothetical protein SmJEL517_g03416 [Synchytrium microbalum]
MLMESVSSSVDEINGIELPLSAKRALDVAEDAIQHSAPKKVKNDLVLNGEEMQDVVNNLPDANQVKNEAKPLINNSFDHPMQDNVTQKDALPFDMNLRRPAEAAPETVTLVVKPSRSKKRAEKQQETTMEWEAPESNVDDGRSKKARKPPVDRSLLPPRPKKQKAPRKPPGSPKEKVHRPPADMSPSKHSNFRTQVAANAKVKNETQESIERRNRYLYQHRELFTPFLNKDRNFFTKLDGKVLSKGHVAAFRSPHEQPPNIVGGEMKDYQLHGLGFLLWLHDNGLNGILGDEMGLGKTLQTISLFSYLKNVRGVSGPYLVVCPLSVLTSWMNELKRWDPTLTVIRFHGQQAEHVFVTTYEQIVAESNYFKARFHFRYVVIDEGHKIKNEASLISQAVSELRTQYRLLLTGTPLQNNLHELWALLHFLFPEVFTPSTSATFDTAFDLVKGVIDNDVLENARKLLERFMIRRLKSQVDLAIPPKEEMTIFVPLSPMQRFWYKRMITRMDLTTFNEIFGGGEASTNGNGVEASTNGNGVEANSSTDSPAANGGGSSSTPMLEASTPRMETSTPMMEVSTPTLEAADTPITMATDEAASDAAGEQPAAAVPAPTAAVVPRYALARKKRPRGRPKASDQRAHEYQVAADMEALSREMQDEWRELQNQGIATKEGGSQWQKLMGLVMQLRKCCNHPYLFPDSEPEPTVSGEHLVSASSKMVLLDKLLTKLKAEGKQVLIFSQFTTMLDILEDYLGMRNYGYARLDGSMSRPRRNLDIELFQKRPSPYFAFLLSTRAGGLGINLTAADTVIFYDSDWNPQADIQAMARAHRIGQTKKVTVYRFVCQDTVEERILSRTQKKLYLSAKVTEEMSDHHSGEPQFSKTELLAMIKFGANAVARMGASYDEFLNEDIQVILDKSQNRNKDEATSESALDDFDITMPEVDVRVFEGQRHNSSFKAVAREWKDNVKRVREARTVMIDGQAVLKETIDNDSWEAVRTITGSRPKGQPAPVSNRKKLDRYINEEQCHCCKDGGLLVLCSRCPRSYHPECIALTEDHVKRMSMFTCPQHNCSTCGRNTADAGGLIFRCQGCRHSFCEDDLPEGVEYVGNTIPELASKGYHQQKTAYWIRCPECVEYIKEQPECMTAEGAFKLGYGLHTQMVAREHSRKGKGKVGGSHAPAPVPIEDLPEEGGELEEEDEEYEDPPRFPHLSQELEALRAEIEEIIKQKSLREITKEVSKPATRAEKITQSQLRDFVNQGVIPAPAAVEALKTWLTARK